MSLAGDIARKSAKQRLEKLRAEVRAGDIARKDAKQRLEVRAGDIVRKDAWQSVFAGLGLDQRAEKLDQRAEKLHNIGTGSNWFQYYNPDLFQDYVSYYSKFDTPELIISEESGTKECYNCKKKLPFNNFFYDEYSDDRHTIFCIYCLEENEGKYRICKHCRSYFITTRQLCNSCNNDKNRFRLYGTIEPKERIAAKKAGYDKEEIYYCYTWIHPETDEIVYIGKGKNARAFCFDRQNQGNSKLTEFLNEYEPIVEFNVKDVNEYTAFKVERKLINQYGRLDLNGGLLLNKTFGFDGKSYKNAPLYYKITCPAEAVMNIKGLKGFCTKIGVNQGNMSNVANGYSKKDNCKGWKCEKAEETKELFDYRTEKCPHCTGSPEKIRGVKYVFATSRCGLKRQVGRPKRPK
jgi:hypothetical protein